MVIDMERYIPIVNDSWGGVTKPVAGIPATAYAIAQLDAR